MDGVFGAISNLLFRLLSGYRSSFSPLRGVSRRSGYRVTESDSGLSGMCGDRIGRAL